MDPEKIYKFRLFKIARKDEKLQQALKVLGVSLTPTDVFSFSLSVSLLVFLVGVVFSIIFRSFYPLLISVISSLLIFIYLYEFFESKAKDKETKDKGKIPAFIGELCVSLRVTPNLEKALLESNDQIAKQMLVNILLRKNKNGIEALERFLKSKNIGKRALYFLNAAINEANPNKRYELLNKCVESLFEELKVENEKRLEKLILPVHTLYFLGLIVPLIMSVVLPAISLSFNFSISSLMIAIFYDVLLPIVLVVAINKILSYRPYTLPSLEIKPTFAFYFIPFISAAYFIRNPLLVFLLVGVIIGFTLLFPNIKKLSKREEFIELEEEFYDSLQILANKLSEGLPLETSLIEVSSSMKNSKISLTYKKAAMKVLIESKSLKKALLESLEGLKSENIKFISKRILEASEKSSEESETLLRQLSAHISTMKSLEKDIRKDLKNVIAPTKLLITFIGPAIAGICVGIQNLIASRLNKISIDQNFLDVNIPKVTVSSDTLAIIIGIYLLVVMVLFSYLISRIENDDDKLMMCFEVGKNCLIGLSIFSFVGLASSFLF